MAQTVSHENKDKKVHKTLIIFQKFTDTKT